MHKLASNRASCASCGLNNLCLAHGLSEEETLRLKKVLSDTLIYKKGEHIYHQGDHAEYVYIVRSGSIKYYNKQMRLLTFYYPSEMTGFDGVDIGHYQATAEAMEDTSVCRIRYQRLIDVMSSTPNLANCVMKLLSHQLNDLLADVKHHKTTEQRFCAFLFKLSESHRKRGYSYREFNLPMSRNDIANYLDLAIETVSRTIHALKDKGIIDVQNKHITILDYDQLTALADIS